MPDGSEEYLPALLLISGIIGLVVGISSSKWQLSIEPAQVLTGLVRLNPHDLGYLYDATAFSLSTHISALLLFVTNSEVATSIILCALIGIIIAQSIAMLFFLGMARLYPSLFVTLLICLAYSLKPGIYIFGHGIAYPIWLFGVEHTFGVVGLIFTVYATLFFAFDRIKTGLFLSPIVLWVHPAWGVWINACIISAVVADFPKNRHILNRYNVLAYSIGIALFLAALFFQKMALPAVPLNQVIDHTEARKIFLSYVTNWDFHRQRFGSPKILSSQLLLVGFTIFASSLCLLRDNSLTDGKRLFLKLALIAAVISPIFVFVPSWFDQAIFPEALITLMPGRFVNYSIFLGIPLLILACAAFFRTASSSKLMNYCLSAFISLDLLLKPPLIRRCFVIVTPLCLLAVLAHSVMSFKQRFERYTDFSQPSAVYGQTGQILTTMDFWLLQIQTRKPLIVPHLDGFVYVGPDALVRLNDLVEDIYGARLTEPPLSPEDFHSSVIHTSSYQSLWEHRGCGEWQRLSRKYDFERIVVPKNISLSTQLIGESHDAKVYGVTCPL
jgi:hypothetical protein